MNRGHLRDCASIFELQPLEVRRFFTTAALSNGTLTITGTNSAETITVNKNSSNRVTITGVSTTFAIGSVARMVINAQGGSDTITITGAVGSNIPSTINAGSGNDVIATGLGDDVIFGQEGFDTVNYSARTSGVRVSLDGAQNDGQTQNGETDNVNAEEVLGGSGNDVFIGNGSANYFSGGAGNDEMAGDSGSDELVGNTGRDALFGEGDNDSIYAKNNDVDTVNGGSGDQDLAETDGIDVGSSGAALNGFARNAAIALQAAGIDPALLDTTYGGNGTGINSAVDLNWDEVTAATVDSQGRVILVGYDRRSNFGYDSDDIVAARFNADGTVDQTFGAGYDGEVAVDLTVANGFGYADDDRAYGVTTDDDDNIIIVGSSYASSELRFSDDVALVCLNEADGSLDGGAGLLRRYEDVFAGDFDDAGVDAVVQDDGKIVIVGNSVGEGGAIVVLRVDDATGDLDESFAEGDGIALLNFGFSSASSVALQTLPEDEGAQRIIVGGFDVDDVLAENFLIVRLTSDGAIDGTFADDAGYLSIDINDGSTDFLNDLAVTSDNEIIAVGQSYFPSGIITFALEPYPNFGARGAVVHVNADGSATDVDLGGDTDVSFNAVAVGDDDSIYVSGAITSYEPFFVDFILARYVLPLSPDSSFNEGELVTTDFSDGEFTEWTDIALGMRVMPDGKVVVGGSSSYLDSETESTVTVPSVARYGVTSRLPGVEEDLTYDDVQNDPGTDKRSETATFYLKSTHLDDQGRALINLTNGNDVVNFLRITAQNGDQQVLVEVNGIYLPFDLTTTSITINGLNGNDTINGNDQVPIPLIINGGAGIDNIRGGGANDIIRGGDGLDVLSGGGGHDVILGEEGISALRGLVDILNGDAGNDLLIGGAGPDALNGGTGEDILIGGTTSYDNDNDALASLSAEWGDTGKTNAQRVLNLKNGGGLNGAFVLKTGSGATVFDDNVVDLYTGGANRDWFFRRTSGTVLQRDSILDNSNNEELTSL